MPTERVNLKQTAANVAATVIGAAVNAGLISDLDEAQAKFEEFASKVFTDLASEHQPQADTRSRAGGGGSSYQDEAEPPSGSEAGLQRSLNMRFNRGVFDGLTIREVADMPASEAEKYGRKGPGIRYIEWLAENDEWPSMQKHAKAVLEARRATSA